MFRFSKPETPRAALFVFLRNETRAKSGFVSYVSISLCFDFDPTRQSSVVGQLALVSLLSRSVAPKTCTNILFLRISQRFTDDDYERNEKKQFNRDKQRGPLETCYK